MRVLFVWFPVALLGCPAATPTDTDTDTDTDVDTDPPTDTGTTGPVTDVSGLVQSVAGAPIAGAQIRFCRGVLCITRTTDAAGAFEITDVQAFPHSFEVIGPDGQGFATGFSVVALEEGVPKPLRMVLPPLGPEQALPASPAWIDVADGLSVEIGAGALETPPFLPDATGIAGARVAEADWPTWDGLSDVRAVWYLSPFDYPAPAGLPVRLANDIGATDGASCSVWVGSYEASEWLDAGDVTLADGVFAGDARLPLVSTVVLACP